MAGTQVTSPNQVTRYERKNIWQIIGFISVLILIFAYKLGIDSAWKIYRIYIYSFTLVSEVGFDLIGMFRLLQSEKWISSDWMSAIATIRFGSCERPRIHVANW